MLVATQVEQNQGWYKGSRRFLRRQVIEHGGGGGDDDDEDEDDDDEDEDDEEPHVSPTPQFQQQAEPGMSGPQFHQYSQHGMHAPPFQQYPEPPREFYQPYCPSPWEYPTNDPYSLQWGHLHGVEDECVRLGGWAQGVDRRLDECLPLRGWAQGVDRRLDEVMDQMRRWNVSVFTLFIDTTL